MLLAPHVLVTGRGRTDLDPTQVTQTQQIGAVLGVLSLLGLLALIAISLPQIIKIIHLHYERWLSSIASSGCSYSSPCFTASRSTR